MIQPSPDERPDIAQVLFVAQQACASIARDGTVSDAIPVGPARPANAAASAAAAQQQRPQSQQAAMTD